MAVKEESFPRQRRGLSRLGAYLDMLLPFFPFLNISQDVMTTEKRDVSHPSYRYTVLKVLMASDVVRVLSLAGV